MTPLQIVKAHCDCFNPEGCLGITTNDQLKLVRFRIENSPCLLAAEQIQRCRHFESAILPMEKRQVWSNDARQSSKLATEFRQGAHEYRIKTGYMAESIRLCPQCKISKIGKGQKLCEKCRDSNKRKTQSESDRKRHAASNGSQHSNSSSISDVDNQ